MSKLPIAATADWWRHGFAPRAAFAKKHDLEPVGGRGISAFSAVFFVVVGLSQDAAVIGPPGERPEPRMPSVVLLLWGNETLDILFAYTVYREDRHSR